MNDYITAQNAQRITGLHKRTLYHHHVSGAIRAVKKRRQSGPGRPGLMYHIDDVRKLAWPGTTELMHASGLDRYEIFRGLYRFNIGGAVFFAGKWRFNPDHFDAIARWYRDGSPVRPGFIPMAVRRH